MTRRCVWCGKTPAAVSYHAFPRDVDVRQKWNKFCSSANIEDNLSSCSRYLCSSHFLAEDYLHPIGSVRNKLKRDAVPSIHCSLGLKSDLTRIEEATENACVSKNPKTESSEDIRLKNVAEASTTPISEIDNVGNDDGIQPMTPRSHRSFPVGSDSTPSNISPYSRFGLNTITDESHSTQFCSRVLAEVPLNISDFDTSIPTPRTSAMHRVKNFFQEPCYIGDIKSPHLATAPRAKRASSLAKITVAKQKSKILSLQQKTRRLKKRITTMKELVLHLRDRNLISEDAADNLINQIPEPMREMLKRRKALKTKYSPELRAFALTLNFYSAKAYDCVRKSFSNLLPEASTIKTWYSVVNGRPGFTAAVFESIKCKVKNKASSLYCTT